jgi:hypothetical protein
LYSTTAGNPGLQETQGLKFLEAVINYILQATEIALVQNAGKKGLTEEMIA